MATPALVDSRPAAPSRARAPRHGPLLAILVADLRQRTRSTRFRVVLLLAAIATWGCFPAPDAGYLVVAIGAHYRGVYSSAWIGMVLAMLTMLWSLVGFYVVRGTLQRDIDTRVWQLLGASSMSRTGYLVAKWASHLLVLLGLLASTLIVGLAAQWVRAEDRHVDLWELVKPALFIALPVLAVNATIVVWFDMIPWLRRTAGNVVFFVAWLALLSTGAARVVHAHDGAHGAARDGRVPVVARQPWTSDFAGLAMMQWSIDAQVRPQFPGSPFADGFCVGCGKLDGQLQRFAWTRWEVSPAALWGRTLWLALAIGGVLAAVPFLDGAASRANAPGVAAKAARAPRALRWLQTALAPLRRVPFGVLVAAETTVLLRMRPAWWWAAWVPLWAAQSLAPRHGIALAMLGGWALLLDAFSRAGLREHEHRTGELVWTAPGAERRLRRARGAMLVGLALAAVAPGLLHAALRDRAMLLPALAIGTSLALWGLASAALTHSNRPFEIVFLVAAYATTQGAPWLDAAAPGAGVALAHAGLAAAAIAVLASVPGPSARRRPPGAIRAWFSRRRDAASGIR